MKIQLLTCIVGDFFVHRAGDIVDMADDEGQRCVDHGIGILITEGVPELENPELKASSRRSRR